MRHATGTFEVKVLPTDVSVVGQSGGLGRMTLDKVFSGALEGTSKGEMLTAGNEAAGAMAYVALETVTGTLEGQRGTFILSHQASMLKSDPAQGTLRVTVVPSSGTGALAGITGQLSILREGGQHRYDFEYALPDAK